MIKRGEKDECPRYDVSDLLDAVDCIELGEVGDWRQGPVRSKVVNIREVEDDQRGGLSVLPCYEIGTEGSHKGSVSITEAENGREREGICDACLGSVIIGESCVCLFGLSDGTRDREQDARGREQDTGGLAARELREKVDCMYHIMTENEGDYLYLEAGTPVSKEESGSDVSDAGEVWERMGIGVTANEQVPNDTVGWQRRPEALLQARNDTAGWQRCPEALPQVRNDTVGWQGGPEALLQARNDTAGWQRGPEALPQARNDTARWQRRPEALPQAGNDTAGWQRGPEALPQDTNDIAGWQRGLDALPKVSNDTTEWQRDLDTFPRVGIGVTVGGWPRISVRDRTLTDGSGAEVV